MKTPRVIVALPPPLSDADREWVARSSYDLVIGGFDGDDELELAGFDTRAAQSHRDS